MPGGAIRPAARKGTKMEKPILYIGTYTWTGSQGIYIFEMDPASGALTAKGTAPRVESPSFLAVDPHHRYLYAVDEIETFGGEKTGAVSAFAIQAGTGALTLLNQQPSEGSGPCHVTVDREGRNVLVANYGSGSVAVIPIEKDGRLGAPTCKIQHQGSGTDPGRQEGPHAHSINLDAANHFAIAADLGLDKLLVYRFDMHKGTLAPASPPFATVAPGSGPRHFAFHPDGRTAYVINELNSTVTAFSYDAATGTLKEIQSLSTLAPGFQGTNNPAEIAVHPSGKFLYGSNRGDNSIVLYTIEPGTGKLHFASTEPTGGKNPRNFVVDPSGKFLLVANQDSDNVVIFRIDAQTGRLTPTGQTIQVPKPVCVRFL
jgi:6-phosphogluconolactonase